MNYLIRPLIFLSQKLSRHQFIALLSIIVGLFSGLTAVALKTSVHFLQEKILLFTTNWFYYALFPAAGILLSVLIIKYFFNGKLDRGVEGVQNDIKNKSSIIAVSKIYSNLFTSAITVGLGGSSGMEGPIIAIGSGIGSNLVKPYRLDYKERTLLLASGAAAGIAAIFNAPVTGMIFAIEVLLADVALYNLIPLMLASVAGTLCSKILLQESILLHFEQYPFDYTNIPYYIILALLTGMVSLYYTSMNHYIVSLFSKLEGHPYIKAFAGGLVLLLLCLLLPPLFGEGYESIKQLAQGHPEKLIEHSILAPFIEDEGWLLLFIVMVMLTKVIATASTIHSGGNGGNFAPSLFVGGMLGYGFSTFINRLNIAVIPVNNFTLVSMAGILSGVMLAPLTAIFLIAEITHGYDLIIPLMLVSSFSFFFVKTLDRYMKGNKPSVFTEKTSYHLKHKTLLSSLNTQELIKKDNATLSMDTTVSNLIEMIRKHNRNVFVVLNEKNTIEGILHLEDIKHIIFDEKKHGKRPVAEIMQLPDDLISIHDPIDNVVAAFDRQERWSLPVVDEHGLYLGLLSRSGIFKEYRRLLTEDDDDFYDEEK